MPIFRTSKRPTQLRRLDVLAKVSGPKPAPTHLMLCYEISDRDDVTASSRIEVAHMGPPLGEFRTHCDVIGTVELSNASRRQIQTFIDERFEEMNALRMAAKAAGERWDSSRQYCIHPVSSPPSREANFWKFNCVGFVLSAYQTAGIQLVSLDCPEVEIAQIKAIYPDSRLDDPLFRSQMGIGNGTTWPVLFPGYVLKSLDRETVELHQKPFPIYHAVQGDEFHPSVDV